MSAKFPGCSMIAGMARIRIATVLACLFVLVTRADAKDGGADTFVVTEVGPAAEAASAGFAAGDQLLGWRLADDAAWSPFVSPYDLMLQNILCDARCTFDVQVRRGGSEQTLRLRAGDWRLSVVPAASPRSANASVPIAELEKLQTSADAGVAAWASARLIVAAAGDERWADTAGPVAALESLAAPTYALMAVADALAVLSRSASYERLQPLLTLGEALLEDPAASRPAALHARLRIAEYMARRGQLDRAERHIAAAEFLLNSMQLSSVFPARLQTLRGSVATVAGDMTRAEAEFLRALATLDSMPGDTGYSRFWVLRGLGMLTTILGRLDTAEAYSTEALELVRKSQDRAAEARLLNNLGILYVRRGDMARAEYAYQEARRLNKELGSWLSYAYNLANLGDIAIARQDDERAEALFSRARDTIIEQSPDSADAAQITTMLANAQFELGKFEEARRNYDASLNIYQRTAPDSVYRADARIGLGDVELALGDQPRAIELFREALAIRAAQLDGSIEHAEAHVYLAAAYEAGGDDAAAQASFVAAEAILRDLAPDSMEYARVLYHLANIADRRDETERAAAYFESAVAAAERQTERLGGADDSRAHFAAAYSELFDGYVRFLLANKENRAAFDAVERYRARLLLTMLAERESSMRFSLPAALVAERRELEGAYTDARDELAALLAEGASAAEIAAARQAIVEHEVARDALTKRLRSVAAGFARLRYPQPLALAAAQASLDAGTLALTYRVSGNDVTLFAVARDRFTTIRLPIDAATLRADVRRFRLLLDLGRHGGPLAPALVDVGRSLHDALIQPAGSLDGYERLLIVADGPLHGLPFAALMTSTTADRPAYLVEAIPVHKVLSLTLYAELRDAGARANASSIAAFANAGDSFRTGVRQAGYVSAVQAMASELPALSYSTDEIREVADLYANQVVFEHAEATTESEFMHHASRADIVHVAAHALVDERHPLDSALVFERGDGRDVSNDGLLQVWEVFDRLQLNASLVVLSSCRSGFGREAASEGLLGLQRAFLYAGADSVVSSLWNVADHATRDLMVAFHEQLTGGQSIDEALRSAQLGLLNGGGETGFLSWLFSDGGAEADYSHPYYWAAFELAGDYRAIRP